MCEQMPVTPAEIKGIQARLLHIHTHTHTHTHTQEVEKERRMRERENMNVPLDTKNMLLLYLKNVFQSPVCKFTNIFLV